MILSSQGGRKWLYLMSFLVVFVSAGVGVKTYLKRKHAQTKPVIVRAWRLPSGAIFVSEDPSSPRLRAFFQHEHLDKVLSPHKRDLERILALARWTSAQFPATSPFPNYPPWDGKIILDRIRRGKTGGFCAQYAFVFGEACLSAGYIPRYLDLASPENPGGHFTTEVYVPSLKKWVVFEAEWGFYYVDAHGNPLSALELHDWATGVRKDPYREVPIQVHHDSSWTRLFYFFRYYLRNNFMSIPVFVRRDNGQMGFEPYRMIWSDRFTSANAVFLSDAIPSTDPRDFDYAVQVGSIPEITWKKRGDFYQALTHEPLYQMCRIRIPKDMLLRIIKQDFVHSSNYHRLKA